MEYWDLLYSEVFQKKMWNTSLAARGEKLVWVPRDSMQRGCFGWWNSILHVDCSGFCTSLVFANAHQRRQAYAMGPWMLLILLWYFLLWCQKRVYYSLESLLTDHSNVKTLPKSNHPLIVWILKILVDRNVWGSLSLLQRKCPNLGKQRCQPLSSTCFDLYQFFDSVFLTCWTFSTC